MSTGPTRTAVVTGAANGLGLSIARRLSADGYELLLVDRSEHVHQVAAELRVTPCVVDLSTEAGPLEVVQAVGTALAGRCDILVNNAGIHPVGQNHLSDIATHDWDLVLRINLTAAFVLCRELVPRMASAGWGRVINIASRAGRTYVPPSGAHYAASKAGMLGLTRQVAGEFAAFGVTANSVAPGRIETPLTADATPDVVAGLLKAVPVGRVGIPSEVADVVSFLASDSAAYITGSCIDVNGGAFMG